MPARPPKLAASTWSCSLRSAGLAERHRLDLERLGGAQQAEAGVVVVADDVGGGLAAGIGDDLGGMRLDHQVADGEDQALVVDDDAGAGALLAETFDRAPVRIDVGLELHDRGEQFVGSRSDCAARQADALATSAIARGSKQLSAPRRARGHDFRDGCSASREALCRANPSQPILAPRGRLPPAAMRPPAVNLWRAGAVPHCASMARARRCRPRARSCRRPSASRPRAFISAIGVAFAAALLHVVELPERVGRIAAGEAGNVAEALEARSVADAAGDGLAVAAGGERLAVARCCPGGT